MGGARAEIGSKLIKPFYVPVSAEIAREVILQNEREKSYITSSSASQSYITEGLQKLYFRGGGLGYFAPPPLKYIRS